jgi:flagellar hook-length control protein FliK
MMSAKTVSTESPAANAATASPNNSVAPAPAGDASGFQNLLGGAAPTAVGPTLVGPLPIQSLAQLLNLKQQQQTALTAAKAVVPIKEVSPGELLKLLDNSATLLPETGHTDDADAAEPKEASDALSETEPKGDSDLLADWVDIMLPPSVFAPQAALNNSAGTQDPAAGGEPARGAALATIPASLMPQAGLPDPNGVTDGATTPASGVPIPGMIPGRQAALAAAQAALGTLVTATGAKPEAADSDKLSPADGWMSALGDLAAKRANDAAPAMMSRLSTPVHDARWADALAHRLVMMARDGESIAQLRLVPQDLGPLDIQISVRDGEASVHFGAASHETRSVLEASMPRLREMLSAQGLQLTNSSVSHQSAGKSSPERPSGTHAVGAVTEETEISAATSISTSLLDIYA